MNGPQLEYAGPRTPTKAPAEPLWLKVTVTLVLIGTFVFFAVKLGDMMSGRSHREVSNLAWVKTDAEMLDDALARFQRDVGRFPTNPEGLKALVEQPDEAESWLGPYLKRPRLPKDPWGNAYVYHAHKPAGNKKYTLLSRGPDGVEGTADDIVNK